MIDAPGPAPDRAAAELVEAERKLRSVFEGRTAFDTMSWRDVGLVLAELDRQRVIVRAAEALVARLDDIPESGKEGLYEADTADEDEPHVGALLDALAVAVRALLEGEKQ
jgi:hypothetical protein